MLHGFSKKSVAHFLYHRGRPPRPSLAWWRRTRPLFALLRAPALCHLARRGRGGGGGLRLRPHPPCAVGEKGEAYATAIPHQADRGCHRHNVSSVSQMYVLSVSMLEK